MQRQRDASSGNQHWPSGRGVLAILAGVSAIAVAQPLLELLGHYPQFLLSHQLGRFDIALLVVGLLTLPPLALWLVVLAVGGRVPRRRWRVLGVVATILMTVAFVPTLGRGVPLPGWALISLAAVLAALLVCLIGRTVVVRPYLSLMGWIPLAIAAVFIGQPRTQDLLFLPSPIPTPATAGSPNTDSPVVVVIFDALPTAALMDADGDLDVDRYPNLAALAVDAVWYRNAMGVSDNTVWAVPAILSGQEPLRRALPLATWYPDNIFSWLAPSRPIHAFESHTRLAGTAATLPFSARWRLALSDLGYLFLHMVIPDDLDDWLPSVRHDWKGFGAGGLATADMKGIIPLRIELFRDFLASLSSHRPVGCHVIHSVLPHTPYRFLPSGAVYSDDDEEPGGEGMQWDHWGGDEPAIRQSEQRFLLQLAYVDRLIGELTARLREQDLYERTLLVVTADHGMSFRARETRRRFSLATVGDIVPVPLIIKYPAGDGDFPAGRIDDRAVCSTDILPTIAAGLGATLPWSGSGVNLLDEAFTGHDSLTVHVEDRSRTLAVRDILDDREASLRRRLAAFGAGPDRALLYAPPQYRDLLGRSVPAAPPTPVGVSLELEDAGVRRCPHAATGLLPAVAVGRVQGPTAALTELAVAVAIDGVIRAVALPHTVEDEAGWRVWSILLPEEHLGPGDHRIEAYLVD